MEKYLIEQLGNFFFELSFEKLPRGVIEKAKACLFNSLAATIGGYDIDLSKKAINLVKRIDGGKGVSTILVDGAKVSSFNAAFANSTMSCSRTQNDTHFQTVAHIGEVVPHVCLAIGEEKKVNGRDFLTALVAGYEVMARVGRGGVPFTIHRGFRSTPVFGTFGACAAAAKLMGLSKEKYVNALGYAANFSSGLLECWHGGTPEYAFQAGVSSQNGMMAVLIAEEGGTSAKTTLEGEKGFYNAFAGSQKGIHAVLDGLGEKYEILEVIFKKFPGELFNQPALETFFALMKEHPLTEKQIEKIRVRMDPVAAKYPGVSNVGPFQTYLDALVSCPFVIGMLCVYEKIAFEKYADYKNRRILEICKKVEVEEEQGRPPMSCYMEIHLTNGKRISKDLGLSLNSYRWSLDETSAFFQEISSPLLGESNVMRLLEEIRYLEKVKDISKLGKLLSRPSVAK